MEQQFGLRILDAMGKGEMPYKINKEIRVRKCSCNQEICLLNTKFSV